MRDLNGKTAVITGAASGMGRAFAERFAQAGMRVVLADIEEDALERAVTELRQQEHEVIGVVTNTMSRDSVEQLAERATTEFGDVHVLCNNAGVASTAVTPIWETPDADWQWLMGVNFWGVLYGVQAFVPRMIAHGQEAHVVNTASLAALVPGLGVYGVSKHAVLALTENLYRDLKARGAQVSASVLCPGFVHTRISDAERNRPADLEGDSPPPAPPLGGFIERGIEPAEVADLVHDSVLNDRFYILPHPTWDPIVRDRVEHVLARGAPLALDLSAISRGMDAGERW